jgi:hypothetical protein
MNIIIIEHIVLPMSLIKGDSLLSNISNVSVLIKPGDGSSVFNFPHHHHSYDHDQSERLCEVKLDDIFPHDDQLHENNSMLNHIIKKEDRDSSIMQFCHPIMPQFTYTAPNNFNEKSWVITQQKGVSEDENTPDSDNNDREEMNEKKLKNETKNIPKNYGKAIITFIEKYRDVVASVCAFTGVPFEDFIGEMSEMKKTINTIADLRRLWIDYKYSRCMRIISNLFFRKYSLNYIFNSRICNFRSHIKYRHRLW